MQAIRPAPSIRTDPVPFAFIGADAGLAREEVLEVLQEMKYPQVVSGKGELHFPRMPAVPVQKPKPQDRPGRPEAPGTGVILDPQEVLLRDGQTLLPIDDADQPACNLDPHRSRRPVKIKGAIAFCMRLCGHNVLM